MRAICQGLAAAGLILAATQGAAAADANNGWDIYGKIDRVSCSGRPVLLQGSHTDVTLAGACRYVRITGEHNDVTVDVRPGGTIEITGAHNDVWWRQRSPGPGPRLVNNGASNTFHHKTDE